MPTTFLYSDPDIQFNERLPNKFWKKLIHISNKYEAGKVGFALDISSPENLRSTKFEIGEGNWFRVWEWEAQFWEQQVSSWPVTPVFKASIDTTFTLINKNYYRPNDFFNALRVAGRFTATHLPWLKTSGVPLSESRFYAANSVGSFYKLDEGIS